MDLDALIRFYQELSLESLEQLPDFYGEAAFFKDPFNEVRGPAAIRRIFEHMFRQVDEPRFIVTGKVADRGGAMLAWEFYFRPRRWGGGAVQVLRGVSHLKFGPDGKVAHHRDYWDAAEELYMKLPVLGCLMRGLRRALAA